MRLRSRSRPPGKPGPLQRSPDHIEGSGTVVADDGVVVDPGSRSEGHPTGPQFPARAP